MKDPFDPLRGALEALPQAQAGALDDTDVETWLLGVHEWASDELANDTREGRAFGARAGEALKRDAALRLALAEIRRQSRFGAMEQALLHTQPDDARSADIVAAKLLKLPVARTATEHWRWRRMQTALTASWEDVSGWKRKPRLTARVRGAHPGWPGEMFRTAQGRLAAVLLVLPGRTMERQFAEIGGPKSLRTAVRIMSLEASNAGTEQQGCAVLHRADGRFRWHGVAYDETAAKEASDAAQRIWDAHVMAGRELGAATDGENPSLETVLRRLPGVPELAAVTAVGAAIARLAADRRDRSRDELDAALQAAGAPAGTVRMGACTLQGKRKRSGEGLQFTADARTADGPLVDGLIEDVSAELEDMHLEASVSAIELLGDLRTPQEGSGAD